MTRLAPSDRTSSTFAVLHTPVTSAPRCLASCTAQPISRKRWPRSRHSHTQPPNEPEAERHIETSQPPVPRRNRCRVSLDQDFIVLRRGLGHLPHLKDLGRPISLIYNCFHREPQV